MYVDNPHPTQRVEVDENEMFQHSLKHHSHRLEIIEDKSTAIVLVGDSSMRRLELFTSDSYYLLGRFAEAPINSNRIDLSSFGPDSVSVSRVHARIHLENNKLYLTDLSSRNGTFVCGRSLEPHHPRVILPETSITLGHLQLKVHLQVQEWGQTSWV
jgi:pSer/pThr/pTyr-binding forkhead associated (FHA) protein